MHNEGMKYLRMPRNVEAKRFRAVRCNAGSSEYNAAWCEEGIVPPSREADDNLDPSTRNIRILRASNGPNGAGTYFSFRTTKQLRRGFRKHCTVWWIRCV